MADIMIDVYGVSNSLTWDRYRLQFFGAIVYYPRSTALVGWGKFNIYSTPCHRKQKLTHRSAFQCIYACIIQHRYGGPSLGPFHATWKWNLANILRPTSQSSPDFYSLERRQPRATFSVREGTACEQARIACVITYRRASRASLWREIHAPIASDCEGFGVRCEGIRRGDIGR